VLNCAPRLKSERVSLFEAVGRILADDIHSDVNMPPSDLSAMDGYACRVQDSTKEMIVIETIAAGAVPKKNVTPGTCSRIMTGAPVPKGADTVIMFEDTVFNEQKGTISVVKTAKKSNIRYHAEDVGKGDKVLDKGTRIEASHIAVLSSVGKATVRVAKMPVVGIIATGDELVEPDKKPGKGKIRNSNSYQLHAQIQSACAIPVYCGIAKDTPESLDAILKASLPKCDVLLLSGGVSMGDFDYVPTVLKANGIKLIFEKVAVKPGKPTVLGTTGKKCLFGLPGNPVSTFVLFEVLVKPFLSRMTGSHSLQPILRLPLAQEISRRKPDRQEFRPVSLTPDSKVVPVRYHGSAHIHAYTKADGIISIPRGQKSLNAGTVVEVQLIR